MRPVQPPRTGVVPPGLPAYGKSGRLPGRGNLPDISPLFGDPSVEVPRFPKKNRKR